MNDTVIDLFVHQYFSTFQIIFLFSSENFCGEEPPHPTPSTPVQGGLLGLWPCLAGLQGAHPSPLTAVSLFCVSVFLFLFCWLNYFVD